MNHDSNTEPLLEWNRLARENAENAIISSMFEAAMKSSEYVETFSSWLLVAAAAIASFLIVNAEKLIPFTSKTGFMICGAFLCISCILGLISKVFALRCKVGIETSALVKKTFAEHLASYEKEEAEIQKNAEFWNITLQSGIRAERVMHEFLLLFPCWIRWLAKRHFIKHANNPQIAYIAQMKNLNMQGFSVFLQAICFLGFLSAGFYFSAQ